MKDEMEMRAPKAAKPDGNEGNFREAVGFLEENHREGKVWKVEKITGAKCGK